MATSTYRFRFRFHISQKGKLQGKGNKFEFILPNGHKATLHCVGAENFDESTELVIISGGYLSSDEALAYAHELKESVLCFGTKFRFGLDLGKEKASSMISRYLKDKIFEDGGIVIIDDVHGISVYSEDHPTSCGGMSCGFLWNSRENSFFVDEVCKIISAPRKVDDKIKLSMELLTASYFEPSPRSRFLTLILAAEAILTPDECSEKVKLIVAELITHTKHSDLGDKEKCSILGSLNWLYKDSISLSLRKMASSYLPDKKYGGLPSDKFIKKCYEARSKLVHTGRVDDSKYEIGGLAANLEVYMTELLSTLACI